MKITMNIRGEENKILPLAKTVYTMYANQGNCDLTQHHYHFPIRDLGFIPKKKKAIIISKCLRVSWQRILCLRPGQYGCRRGLGDCQHFRLVFCRH